MPIPNEALTLMIMNRQPLIFGARDALTELSVRASESGLDLSRQRLHPLAKDATNAAEACSLSSRKKALRYSGHSPSPSAAISRISRRVASRSQKWSVGVSKHLTRGEWAKRNFSPFSQIAENSWLMTTSSRRPNEALEPTASRSDE